MCAGAIGYFVAHRAADAAQQHQEHREQRRQAAEERRAAADAAGVGRPAGSRAAATTPAKGTSWLARMARAVAEDEDGNGPRWPII